MTWDSSKNTGDTLTAIEWDDHVIDQKGHKLRHQILGIDEINIEGLLGEPSTLITHKGLTTGIHGVSGTIVGSNDSITLTNKTLDASMNSISNIVNSCIKSTAAIVESKLAFNTSTGHIHDGTTAKILSHVFASQTRLLNTPYQNSNARPMMIIATARCSISVATGFAWVQGKSDASSNPVTVASGIVGIESGLLNEDNSFQIMFICQPSEYYQLDSSSNNGTVTLGLWFEALL